MKTITNTYPDPMIPKIWMTTMTGLSYLFISMLLYIKPFASIPTMLQSFGVLLLPASLFDLYFSTENRERIYSWGFNFLNATSDLLMALIFILNQELGTSFLLYFGSFWLLSKGIVTLNFAYLVKKLKIVNSLYTLLGVSVISLSMALITKELFSLQQIGNMFALCILLCSLSKFISIRYMNKKYY